MVMGRAFSLCGVGTFPGSIGGFCLNARFRER
jgi:hypothetical protein